MPSNSYLSASSVYTAGRRINCFLSFPLNKSLVSKVENAKREKRVTGLMSKIAAPAKIQIPVMALLQWHIESLMPFPGREHQVSLKQSLFNLQDLWAFHGPRAALNLQSGVSCCPLAVPVHLSCSPLCWLLMSSYCLRSPAVSQKAPHQYSEPHSFSLKSFAWLLCWTGRKAGANWKNSIP